MFGEELYLVNKYAKKIRDEKRLIKKQIKGVLFDEEDYSEKEISERLKLEIDKISPKVLNLYNMENEDEIIEQIRKTIIEIFKEECPCKKDIYFECDEKANVVKVTWIYEGAVVFGMFDNRVYVTTEESSQGWLTSFYEDVKEIADGLDKPKEEFIDEVVDYEYLTMPAERKMCWDDKEDLKKKEHVEDVDFYWTAIEYVKEKDEYLEMLEVGFDNWANDNPDFLKRAEEIFYAWKAQILKDIKEYEEREISK